VKYQDILRFVDRFGKVSYLLGGRAFDTMKNARAAVDDWKRISKV